MSSKGAETSALPVTPVAESDALAVSQSISDPLNSTAAASFTDSASTLTDTLIQTVPPLAYGDFGHLGLTTNSPIGLVAYSLELINVSTGLPWFWTLVTGAALWRAICVPAALGGVRAAARMRPFQPKILQMQEKITEAKQKQDMVALQRGSIELRKIYAEAGVNPFTGMMLPTLVQVPVSIGVFFASKRICEKVVQLQDGGVSWFWANNLAVADPTYILPVAFAGLMNVQIIVGARDLNMDASPAAAHMMNGMRALSVLAGVFMSQLPAGVLVSLLTTSVLTITQSLLLRSNAFRALVKIPPIPEGQGKTKLPSMMETVAFVRNWYAQASAPKAPGRAK